MHKNYENCAGPSLLCRQNFPDIVQAAAYRRHASYISSAAAILKVNIFPNDLNTVEYKLLFEISTSLCVWECWVINKAKFWYISLFPEDEKQRSWANFAT